MYERERQLYTKDNEKFLVSADKWSWRDIDYTHKKRRYSTNNNINNFKFRGCRELMARKKVCSERRKLPP